MVQAMRSSLLAGAVVLAGAATAGATPILFNFNYSGAPFGNTAIAVGTSTMDDALLPNHGLLGNGPSGALGITAFSITVSGAGSGNGTFTLSQVTNWVWSMSASINLFVQLLGQPGFVDFNWCATGFAGCTPPAP